MKHGFEKLTNKNFLLFAAKNYINEQCMTTEEFQEDLQKFKYRIVIKIDFKFSE